MWSQKGSCGDTLNILSRGSGLGALGTGVFPSSFITLGGGVARVGQDVVVAKSPRFSLPATYGGRSDRPVGRETSTTCRLFRYPVAAGTGTTRRATPAPSTPPPRPPRLPRCSSPTSPLRELVHRTRAAGATSAPPRGHKKTAREAGATRAKRKRGLMLETLE